MVIRLKDFTVKELENVLIKKLEKVSNSRS